MKRLVYFIQNAENGYGKTGNGSAGSNENISVITQLATSIDQMLILYADK